MYETLEKRIILPEIDSEQAAAEIGEFVVNQVISHSSTGCVIGLSGGVDSTTTAALIKKAFDRYNSSVSADNQKKQLEVVGYILPSDTNNPDDTRDGINVAERLGIRHEVHSIEKILEAFQSTNPEALAVKYDKGNLMSRIRANILSTKAATENKTLAGTGNKDEDFGIGYYTLFGDGAVHISPIGNLSKRLVRQMSCYFGFEDIAKRIPTAGLEPGQTDYKDLGYDYDVVELVSEGFSQGLTREEIIVHSQIKPVVEHQINLYESKYGHKKFNSVGEVVDDIVRRHYIADEKAKIIHPPIAPVTLMYR